MESRVLQLPYALPCDPAVQFRPHDSLPSLHETDLHTPFVEKASFVDQAFKASLLEVLSQTEHYYRGWFLRKGSTESVHFYIGIRL